MVNAYTHAPCCFFKNLANFQFRVCWHSSMNSFEKHLDELLEKNAWLEFLAENVCLDCLPKSVSIHSHADMMTPSTANV